MATKPIDHLVAKLEIDLTEPPERIVPNLLNLRAPSSAQIRSISLTAEVFDDEDVDPRPLTVAELDLVMLHEPVIRLRSLAGDPVEHRAPNGRHFTVRDLLGAVEETERRTRSQTSWFGGVDVHHIFFEGVHPEADGTWSIVWGS
jgi:hypothetical protein